MLKTKSGGHATSLVNPPLKWHGGKHDLAKWIISLMPARCENPNKPDPDDGGYLHYVEPYFGGGSVLLANDAEGISEVVNDRNGELTNFWRVLQSETEFGRFQRLIEAVPFSQVEFDEAIGECVHVFANHRATTDGYDETVRRAVLFFIRCRQSLAGRMQGFTGVTKTRTRRGMNNEVSAWLSAIAGLPAVHARLRRVLIVGPSSALEVIRKHDGPRTLIYADPPYMHETRSTTGEYKHEMSVEDHKELLDTLAGIKGRFLLSGYHSDLYDNAANKYGWNVHEKLINNHAAGGKKKAIMTEVVWCNYGNRCAPGTLETCALQG